VGGRIVRPTQQNSSQSPVFAVSFKLENVGFQFLSLRQRPKTYRLSGVTGRAVWAFYAAVLARTSGLHGGLFTCFCSLTGLFSPVLCTTAIWYKAPRIRIYGHLVEAEFESHSHTGFYDQSGELSVFVQIPESGSSGFRGTVLMSERAHEIRCCLNCGRSNRVPRYSVRQIPRCGNCGLPLPELPITRGLRYIHRFRYYAGAASVGLLGILALRAVPTEWIRPIAEWIVVASLAVCAIFYLGSKKRNKPSAKEFAGRLASDLKAKVNMLATKAWGSQEEIGSTPFVLNPSMVGKLGHPELVRGLLQHVAKVAPLLSVPDMVPRIVIERFM
jgi:hypothetical protein